jgi:hypothetical protein
MKNVLPSKPMTPNRIYGSDEILSGIRWIQHNIIVLLRCCYRLIFGSFKIKPKHLFFLSGLFSFSIASAQLPNFSIQLTATPETCIGNGSLSWSVSDTTPGSTLVYAIY